jgi:hypothetical protein
MKKSSIVLAVDAFINYALGILCLLYPFVAPSLGMPLVDNFFYPSILGAVLFGIGIALTIEYVRKDGGLVGLGLGGAVAINLAGGAALILWLIIGDLAIPARGDAFLWVLAILLILISGYELYVHLKGMQR